MVKKEEQQPATTEEILATLPNLGSLDDAGLIELGKKLLPAERDALMHYERSHRNRKRVLDALKAQQKEDKKGT